MRRIILAGLTLALSLPVLADESVLLGTDVTSLKEDPLLKPGRKPALRALGERFHPEREPLILVHGLNGDFADLQPLVDHFKNDPRFQLYLLAYADKKERTSENGDDFADELRSLSKTLGRGRDVSIVAHSMGGLVTRRALNSLAVGPAKGLDCFGRVRFVAIDSPWSGFAGPSDRGFGGFSMKIVAVFMPDGLEDMRAKSNMFRGDSKSQDAAARAGLFGVKLPAKVETTLVFAESGDQAVDYTEEPVSPLAAKIVGAYSRDEAVDGDQRIKNMWRALHGSRTFPAFENDVKALASRRALNETAVRAMLEEHFPRFPGDHSSVIGNEKLLEHIDSVLGSARPSVLAR